MELNWVTIIYFLLLLDSMGAILMAWFGREYWLNMGSFAKYFPPAKGWAVYYFILVLVIGYFLGIL